jgi:hypothetical protein
MAVDRSGGEHDGRVYLAFTDQADLDNNADTGNADDHNDVDIYVLATDGNVLSWTALEDAPDAINRQVRVSHDDPGNGSQFFASVSVDQKTGYVAIGWYDTRNSSGNDEVEYFVAYSKDGGETWSENTKVSDGATNGGTAGSNDLGLYSAVAFDHGVIHMAWTDNSNSTDDNPDGALQQSDIYYDRLSLTTSYLGIQAGLDDAHLIGVPGFEIFANGTVKMNKAKDIDGNVSPLRMNWEEATTTHDEDEKLADLEIPAELALQVKGAAAINIAGVLLAYTGLVEITFAEMEVSDGEVELKDASVISIEVDGADLFVGKDGALLSDHSGLDGDAIRENATGFFVEDVEVRLVVATGSPDDPNEDNRGDSYIGLEAELGSAELVGIEAFELFVNGTVKLNRATDADGKTQLTPRMHWGKATGAEAGEEEEEAGENRDPDDLLADLDIPSDLILKITGSAAINATFSAGLVAYTGDVEIIFSQTTVEDGNITMPDADVMSISVEDAAVFVGSGGELNATHTGLNEEKIHDEGVGFLVNGASFKMVLARGAAKGLVGADGEDVNIT